MPYARSMKKWLRFIAWLAGVAVFLLATAHFTLRHLLNAPKFKAAATGRIERTTGRAIDYGRIDYRLFPFALVVRNASLKERDGVREFASIRSFSATVDFRKKEISELRLEQPAIRIVQRADGTFNFSDLVSSGPEGKSAPPKPATPKPAPVPAPVPAPAAAPFAIRLVEIDKARFEFVRIHENGAEETFTLSDLDFQLRDFAPGKPFRMDGSAAIGKTSSLAFELSGPAPAEYARSWGAWPADFNSRLAIRDFADLKAFLPEGTLPFQSLDATLHLQGPLADKWRILLNLRTPEATETHPAALELACSGEVSLPAPVAQHLIDGTPLPEEFQFTPPPCDPPPGSVSPGADPWLALLLKQLRAKVGISIPRMAYGQNRLSGGTVANLGNGALEIPLARFSAYGGTLEARGNVQLLACPLAYRLDRLVAQDLSIEQALAANGLDDFAHLSGKLQLEASATAFAGAEPALRALEADAKARIDGLQSVGTGGSLMDQVWIQLDNPLLLKLVPRLKPKIENAKATASAVTTSRYDEATATLSLRKGLATLSGARLAMPGYRLDLSGTILPFDDRLDLAARLIASPEETANLTGGKDLSAYLPYENGGLMVPLSIRGPWRSPEVLPDLDLLLENALNGIVGGGNESAGSPLDALSGSDRKNVEKGLQILGSFLQP